MEKVLCFGDSNTYGFIPGSGRRYNVKSRWTGILKNLCNNRFEIIEAGCNNRTCFINNPAGKEQTGYKILPHLIQDDLSYVILAIGINDLQFLFNPSLADIKLGIEQLIKIVQEQCPKAKIIVASPSTLTEDVLHGYFSIQFDKTSIEKSYKISNIYKQASEEFNCSFIDLDKVAKVSPIDGLHYEEKEHRLIAQALFLLLDELSRTLKNSPNATV